MKKKERKCPNHPSRDRMKLVLMIWCRTFPEIYLRPQCMTLLFRVAFPFKDQIYPMKDLKYISVCETNFHLARSFLVFFPLAFSRMLLSTDNILSSTFKPTREKISHPKPILSFNQPSQFNKKILCAASI